MKKVNCPYCGNECACDTVNNGLAYIQCGPYYCDKCGASEIGIYDGQYTNRKLTAEEERTGWYRPGSPAGPLTPTVGGKIVDHKTAKAAYEVGMLDPIPSEPIYADDDPFDEWTSMTDMTVVVHPTQSGHVREVAPHDGGCWYCHKVDENLVFSIEWDAYVHLACVRQALERNPQDAEAWVFARELGVELIEEEVEADA